MTRIPSGRTLSVIPLTSTIGYQANTHVIIHFRDGNPDMGRKVFQPEIKALGEKISRQVVNIFKRFLHLMREDTGAPSGQETSDLWHWTIELVEYRRANPLDFVWKGVSLAYVSEPRCEQDVVALFHELVGMGIFPGMRFLASSETKKYDSCYVTQYYDRSFTFNKTDNPLGVSEGHIIVSAKESKPFILEFKYDFDAVVTDIEKEAKFLSDIDCVVCWEIGNAYSERYRILSLLVGEEGASRSVYGATHALYSGGERRFEVICVKDLLSFHRNRAEIIAVHAQRFKA